MNNAKFPQIVTQMKSHKETTKDIARILNIKYNSQITRRINGQVEWTVREAKILCKHYNIEFEKLFKEEVKEC